MSKLTDTQLIILSKAAARDDGAATIPTNLNKANAAMVGSSLVARNLMQEVFLSAECPFGARMTRASASALSLQARAARRSASSTTAALLWRGRRKRAAIL